MTTTALIGNEALHHAVEAYAARHDLGPGGTVIPEQAGSYVRRSLACDPRRVLAAWCDDHWLFLHGVDANEAAR